MKKCIVFILCLLLNTDGFSQYNSNNLKKYWFYRKRLIDYFTVIGSGTGESNIAARRNDKEHWNTANFSGRLEFGDQTMNLGDYLAVLATEYKLLNDNNQDVSQTAKEIYYALYAINRLDLAAETVFGLPAELNGFFLRTDVDNTFIDAHPEINKGLPLPPQPYAVGSGFPQAVDVEHGAEAPGWIIPDINTYGCALFDLDKDNSGGDDWKNRITTSPDQIIGLYTGLALVVKCVPQSANYNGMYFFNEARTITDRITMWMKNHSWNIETPTGCVVYSEPKWMAHAYAIAAGEIMGDRNKYLDWISTPTLLSWCAIDGLLAAGDICSINTDWTPCEREYNWKIVLTLAAIGDSWNNCDCAALQAGALGLACFIPGTDITNLSILAHASVFEWGSYYSLLFNVLHGKIYWFPNSTTEDQLSSAPCDGPFNHNTNPGYPYDNSLNGWACQFRFRGSVLEQQIGGDIEDGFITGTRGNFPGLDYMLLHNLYYISRLGANGKDSDGNDLPFYGNEMDKTSATDYPHPSGFGPNTGSLIIQKKINAFRSINYSGTVHAVAGDPNNTGDVILRAGETVSMEPESLYVSFLGGGGFWYVKEFEVEEGAEFYAYSDPFECDAAGEYKSLNQSGKPDTTTSKNLYGFEDSEWQKNNFVPLTYDNENYQTLNYGTLKTALKNNKPDSAASVSTTPAKQPGEVNHSKNEQQSEIPAPTYSGSNLHSPIIITPNPTTGRTVIYFSPEQITSATARLEITDIVGQKVFEKNPFAQGVNNYIDLSHLQKGVYFLKISTEDEVRVEKVVVE